MAAEISQEKHDKVADVDDNAGSHQASVDDAPKQKPFLQAALPVFACGAGLFSDGYINNASLRPADTKAWLTLHHLFAGNRLGQYPPDAPVRHNLY